MESDPRQWIQTLRQSHDRLAGIVAKLSPEQVSGIKTDPRTDLYSTGVLLYELCVGSRPFIAADPFQILAMHRDAPPVPPRTAAPARGLSEALERVILRALAKNPDERFIDAAEFLAALDDTPEGKRARAGTGGGRQRLVRYAVVAAIIVLATLAVAAATHLR